MSYKAKLGTCLKILRHQKKMTPQKLRCVNRQIIVIASKSSVHLSYAVCYFDLLIGIDRERYT